MHRFANPARFLRIARPLTPLFGGLGLVLVATGLGIGLFASPPDYLQGESVRIMYVHVPAAWLGLSGYLTVGLAGAAALVWRHPLAHVAADAAAIPGAVFTALCLVTGSLWGKPTWGTWWVWDARLSSMLVLLFLYLGYIGLAHALDDEERSHRSAAVLAVVGLVNLPIIKYSVEWWNTLHQGSSIRLTGSSIDGAMLLPLMISATGFTCLFAAITLMRMRAILATQVATARLSRLAGAHA
jgi:heme exporter protein C